MFTQATNRKANNQRSLSLHFTKHTIYSKILTSEECKQITNQLLDRHSVLMFMLATKVTGFRSAKLRK